jgi:hypothetical protein
MATRGDFHWPPVGITDGHQRGQSKAKDGENPKAIDTGAERDRLQTESSVGTCGRRV